MLMLMLMLMFIYHLLDVPNNVYFDFMFKSSERSHTRIIF